MKTLLLLNGVQGWQTGIEDGFVCLKEKGEISKLKWFYYQDYAKQSPAEDCCKKIKQIADEFLPELIVFFHVGNFPVNAGLLLSLQNLSSKPFIVYDEGDMYGGFAKPATSSMKLLMKHVDAVSLRGLGAWSAYVRKFNKNIIYTPHHNDVARFDHSSALKQSREHELVLIGNRIRPRFLGGIRSMPGVKGRDRFVGSMSNHFGSRFKLYGNGWDSFPNNCGPVEFQQQVEYYRNTWITVAYEHYPEIPYYFSNRLPAALMAGSLYICHYHHGYEKILPEGDFIFFFRSSQEAVDIADYVLSLEKDDLLARGRRAIKFATERYSPEAAWRRFFYCVKEKRSGAQCKEQFDGV